VTTSYFGDLKSDIFDAGGPQCHFVTSLYCVLTKFFKKFEVYTA